MIENFLREDPFFHLYEIGDLDDFFWPHTRWIALYSGKKLISILLLYNDVRLPVLLALNHKTQPLEMKVLPFLKHLLPFHLNAHLTTEFVDLLKHEYLVESSGLHYKMGLLNYSFIQTKDISRVVRLSTENRDELLELYKISYPGNWFNEKMLQTGQYYGIKIKNQVVSVAGVHVYSEKYRVAALGNITTHPKHRNQGLGETVTACLCRQLDDWVEHIGLNVHSGNHSAIRCYRKLGFEIIGQYEECKLTLKN